MRKDLTIIFKKVFSVSILIILAFFVYRTAAFDKKTLTEQTENTEKICQEEVSEEAHMTEMSESNESEVLTAMSETAGMKRKSTVKVENIKKSFREITLAQLDEAERTADGTTAQYWESDLIFLGRTGDFALYGMNKDRVSRGLILRRNDQLFFTDEYYLAPGLYYPALFADDFDKDGMLEPVIILHRLTGTGYSVEELFLLDDTEQEKVSDWKLYPFKEQDYLSQIEKLLKYEILADTYQVHLFTLDNSQDICVNLTEELSYDDTTVTLEEKIAIGDIVSFQADQNTLTLSFDVGLLCNEFATPFYSESLPLVEAEISYQKGAFTIENMKFINNSD